MRGQDRLVRSLAAICALAWIAAAIRPVDWQAWILENVLLVLFVGLLALRHRRLQLSNVAYLFIAIFVLLHIAGAHYTYAQMPLGIWAKDYFGFARNHSRSGGPFRVRFYWFSLCASCCSGSAVSIGVELLAGPAVILAASDSLKSSRASRRKSWRRAESSMARRPGG